MITLKHNKTVLAEDQVININGLDYTVKQLWTAVKRYEDDKANSRKYKTERRKQQKVEQSEK